ncbi:hypothetical protein DNTS_011726 [Danionella cerebrum]|uniref:Flavodoxin-like fold domain-containing protein n=1 Tax=Danionella cerebrum TaxID=2873325 RepID=A0A553P187_9TELE|nr:hypothetical protein DNTS_011726 [Danionella translucida]
MAEKTALIVYAHQNKRSFNAAARDVAVQALSKQGYKVFVTDLYAANFKASATADDIKGDLQDPENFVYNTEMMVAWKDGRLSDDIAEEQHKVQQADLIIFQFPLYWFGVPAILKGWIDRVLTQGFAFSMQNMYDTGIFKNKKAIISLTTGGTESMYQPDGVHGDINILLWPLQARSTFT